MPKPYTDPARKAWPFFALFVLVGLGFMTPFVLQAIRDYRIAYIYQPTECEIMSERTVTSESTSKLGRHWVTNRSSHKEFTWAYRIDKRHYVAEGYDNHDGIMTDDQEMGNISKGMKHECWYDPAKPEKSVLVRQFHPKFYLGALIPGSFVLVGGMLLGGVLRRRPMKTQACISQGERLPYRLAPVLSIRGIVGCLGTVVLVLGLLIVLVLPKISVGQSGSGLISGKAWLYLICTAIEGFLIYHLARAVRAAGVPDPVVEIAHEPLSPGQTTQLYIRHPGPVNLASLQVQVVCEKIGQSGTRSAHKHPIFDRNAVCITDVLEINETFDVPPNAPLSAKTVQTATNWCVRIRRKLDSGVSYDTDYPFHVQAKGTDDT
jgi:hypothetical protein